MIKNFFKSLSIYGLIPVATKSAALIVVPIYTRILSPEQFGISELFLTFVMFFNFLIGMELYSGVGRYYNEKKNINLLKPLISTGLLFTLSVGIIVTYFLIFFKNFAYEILTPSDLGYKYHYEFLVVLSLPLLLSIYDYLSVMMRYAGKPKAYLRISLIQLFIKISTTLILLLIFDKGLVSIFYGLIVGISMTIILLLIETKEYLGFSFNKNILKEILLFSLPIYPGLLVLGFSKPLIRWLISIELSIESLGYYSMAAQIVSVFAIIQTGFRMTYRPFIFENMDKPEFITKLESILKLFLIPIALILLPLIIFPYEFLKIFSGDKYLEAVNIVGFLAIGSSIQICTEFVSFGPDIVKKTKYHTFNGIIDIISQISLLYIFIHFWGFKGIGIGFFIASIINFLLKYLTTIILLKKKINLNFIYYLYVFLITVNLIMNYFYQFNIIYKISIFIFTLLFTFFFILKIHNFSYLISRIKSNFLFKCNNIFFE